MPTPATSQNALAPGLARKVKKVLVTKIDNPELSKSLAELSAIHTTNTPASRRALRSNIEKQGLKINEEFLHVAEAAQAALEAVEKQLEGLANCCTRIGSSLEASRNSTNDLVGETSKLKKELAECEARSTMVGSFLKDYQLSNDEVLALREGEVGDAFFASLEHVKEIHKNCKLLLRTHHQRAGLELMDVMAMHQETAYERLCRWVQAECRTLGDTDTPEVSQFLQRAAGTLRGRPVLFKYCAEEVANQRHNALFRRFIAALTRGGPNGMPRPMEMHAHDPRRYVGDMLAWLHQALASEHELMHSLFGGDAAAGAEASAAEGSAYGEEEPWDTPTILDRVFEGVCRPFKVRVEQVLTTVPGTIAPSLLLTFRISVLLSFYLETVGGFIKPEAGLCDTLRECRELAQRTFFDVLKAKGDKLVRNPPLPAKDLAPPAACGSAVHQLIELLESPDASMAVGEGKEEFAPILDAVIDPLVGMCAKSAELLEEANKRDEKQTLAAPAPSWAGPVFQVNCLVAVQQPLEAYPAAAGKCAQLKALVDGLLDAMVAAERQRILAECGLAEKAELIKMYAEGEEAANQVVMSLDPSLSLAAVAAAMNALFAAISAADGGLPEFELLQAPKLRMETTGKLAAAVADAYACVHAALLDPKHGYERAEAALKHTPAQMRTICGL